MTLNSPFLVVIFALIYGNGINCSPVIKIFNVEPSQYAPDIQIENQQLFLVTNVTRLELHCDAHFPVQWDFVGDTV